MRDRLPEQNWWVRKWPTNKQTERWKSFWTILEPPNWPKYCLLLCYKWHCCVYRRPVLSQLISLRALFLHINVNISPSVCTSPKLVFAYGSRVKFCTHFSFSIRTKSFRPCRVPWLSQSNNIRQRVQIILMFFVVQSFLIWSHLKY
jgi:hypothetical protein